MRWNESRILLFFCCFDLFLEIIVEIELGVLEGQMVSLLLGFTMQGLLVVSF